jgi:hypothetical protein
MNATDRILHLDFIGIAVDGEGSVLAGYADACAGTWRQRRSQHLRR